MTYTVERRRIRVLNSGHWEGPWVKDKDYKQAKFAMARAFKNSLTVIKQYLSDGSLYYGYTESRIVVSN